MKKKEIEKILLKFGLILAVLGVLAVGGSVVGYLLMMGFEVWSASPSASFMIWGIVLVGLGLSLCIPFMRFIED